MARVLLRPAGKLMAWLTANPKQANRVMEAVVRVVTYTGTRAQEKHGELADNRHWVCVPHE